MSSVTNIAIRPLPWSLIQVLGSRKPKMAATWVAVFTLPPQDAAMTWYLTTAMRITVTATSLARMIPVTHHDNNPYTDKQIKAAAISALSAIGSASLPKSVTMPRVRARWPS
jgi:hypothetical protein